MGSPGLSAAKGTLDLRFLGRCVRLLRLAAPRVRDAALLLALPLAVAASIAVGFVVVLVPGRMYRHLLLADWSALKKELLGFLLIAFGATLARVFRAVFGEATANVLRGNLTRALHQRYADHATYHALWASRSDIDNPDQRLVTDVRLFCSELLTVWGGTEGSGGIFEGVGNVVWYTYQTWRRGGPFGVGVAFGWAALVSAGNGALINLVAPWVLRQEMLEAAFRYFHVQWRCHAEEVAFQDGGAAERQAVDRRLGLAVANTAVIIRRRMVLHAVQFGFSYYSTAVMYGTVAVAVAAGLDGAEGAGADRALYVAQFLAVFLNLIWGFTILVQLGPQVSNVVAYATRVAQLAEAIAAVPTQTGPSPSGVETTSYDPPSPPPPPSDPRPRIAAQDLEVRLPTGEILLASVTFTVREGDRLLITGPAGCGKTSLLRVLKGLWPTARGHLERPAAGSLAFVPQRAHLPGGLTLGGLMTYPAEPPPPGDAHLEGLVAALGLGDVVRRAGGLTAVADDWEQVLSGGEAQQVCVARAAYHRPQFVVLDEATSHMDADTECRAYTLLTALGAGIVTVGHRPSLRPYHTLSLDLTHCPATMGPLPEPPDPDPTL